MRPGINCYDSCRAKNKQSFENISMRNRTSVTFVLELPGAAKHPTQLLLDPGVGRVNNRRRMPFRTDGREPSLWRPRGLGRWSTSRSPSAGILPAISASILSCHKPWQMKTEIEANIISKN